ncbi:hypothetical protein U0355_10525 [Salimicrobium sp. PL1-032A]
MTLLFTKGRELMEEDLKKNFAQKAETEKTKKHTKTRSGKWFTKETKKK